MHAARAPAPYSLCATYTSILSSVQRPKTGDRSPPGEGRPKLHMDLKKLSLDELSKLVVYISEEIELRRREETERQAKSFENPQPASTRNQTIKPATQNDPKHVLQLENDDQPPAKKRLKGVVASNRYESLPIEDIDEDENSDSDHMSDEDFPSLPSAQQSPPRSKNTTQPKKPQQKDEPENQTRKEKIPPIILHQKEMWTAVSQKLNNSNISFEKAKTTAEGIRIHPSTSDDYRATIKVLNNMKAQYHFYQLPSEKLLHVVLRGVPEPTEETEIKQELEAKGFHPKTITRLRKYKDKTPMPLVLVTVPKTEKHIYHLKHIANVSIGVESQRQKAQITQCFRCQRFGHAQSRCTVRPKCVKCAGNHHYTECEKDKNAPAKCANCGENHTASYRGCSSWPQPRRNIEKPKAEGTSYAQVTKSDAQTTSSNMSPAELFASFQQMYVQMQELAKKLSQMFTTTTQSTH